MAADIPYTFPKNHTFVNRQVNDNEFVFFSPNLAQDANYVENASFNFSDNLDLVVDDLNLNVSVVKTNISDVSMIDLLIGDPLSHQFVCAYAFMRWEWLCEVEFHGEGYFTFAFDHEHSRNTALTMGSLVLRDSLEMIDFSLSLSLY